MWQFIGSISRCLCLVFVFQRLAIFSLSIFANTGFLQFFVHMHKFSLIFNFMVCFIVFPKHNLNPDLTPHAPIHHAATTGWGNNFPTDCPSAFVRNTTGKCKSPSDLLMLRFLKEWGGPRDSPLRMLVRLWSPAEMYGFKAPGEKFLVCKMASVCVCGPRIYFILHTFWQTVPKCTRARRDA